MALQEVTSLLGDSSFTWSARRARLQGWRDRDAECAAAAALAQRIGPAVCAAGAFGGVLTASPVVLALFAATAVAGTFASNHPFEALYNRWAVGRGRPALPPNRAARRLGCAIGAVVLGAAAAAYALGATGLGSLLALVLGSTAAFVAVTGICVPSVLFTLVWGSERACAPSLFAAAATSANSAYPEGRRR